MNSFDDLKAKAAYVPGKIVVYNVPYVSYGVTVAYRSLGASGISVLLYAMHTRD